MASLLGEIKRRKVFQVAAVYAVIAWLLIQIITAVEEPLTLPGWTDSLVIVLLALGFPVALIMSWAYDLTAEGLVRDRGPQAPARSGGRSIEYLLIALLIVAVGWVIYRVEFDSAGVTQAAGDVLPNSIAVLPFDNLSPDPDNDYFAAGIHEEVLNQLVKVRDLNVIARTSVLQYAQAERPITEIARELNVGAVLEGSVAYAEGRVAVTAQLIDAGTGVHVWSERYNRAFANIFDIQADIATRIAEALEAELLPDERRNIARAPTDSPEAYQYYLRALAALEEQGNRAALGYLNQAIETDPNFALAYTQRARSLGRSIVNSSVGFAVSSAEQSETAELALADAQRALSLDSDLGYAYVARARIYTYTWRMAEARESLDRAVEISPNDPLVLRDYALLGSVVGAADRAVRYGRRAVDLDPGNYEAYFYLGLALLEDGDGAGAVRAFRDAVSRDTTAILRIADIGTVEARFGDPAEGERILRLAEEFVAADASQVGEAYRPRRAFAYYQLGLHEDARRVFEEFENWAADQSVGAGDWAMSYLAIGDTERALEWLNRAADKVEAHEPDQGFWHLTVIGSNVYADPVLERPEFVAVRRRLGFGG